MADGNFEAKVHSRRESRDGVFITLSIHPNDLTPDLAMLRVGSALMVGYSEIVNTAVEPLEPMGNPARSGPYKAGLGPDSSGNLAGVTAGKTAPALNEPGNSEVEVCGEPHGVAGSIPAPARQKDRKPFHTLPLVQQAGIRTCDDKFRKFMTELYGLSYPRTEEDVAESIRILCGVNSRSEIIQDTQAGETWLELENRFQSWLVTQKYADVYR